MIGYYNYSVLMTYAGLTVSVLGMIQAVNGRFRLAILCLAVSGLCDMFDGKIARSMKNRTDNEKRFGIQIDSLCDVVCFGAFPILLCYLLGMKSFLGVLILVGYGLASVIRLGFFNVMEETGGNRDEEGNKYYSGLPVTSIAVILPLVYAAGMVLPREFFLLLHLVLAVTALLFITNFKLKKPANTTLAVLVAVVALVLLRILRFF